MKRKKSKSIKKLPFLNHIFCHFYEVSRFFPTYKYDIMYKANNRENN